MTESREISPEIAPQKLDKKLKKDSVDEIPFDNPLAKRRLIPFLAAPLTASAVYIGSILANNYRMLEASQKILEQTPRAIFPLTSLELNLAIVAGSIFAVRGVKDLATQQWQNSRARKRERIHSVTEEELGYRADRCVYQAKTPIAIGEETFKKGDNFYFIQLPSMPPDAIASQPEALNAWLDAYNYSIRDIKEKIKGKDYKFVAIDTPPLPSQQSPDSAFRGSRKELFAGKQGRKIKEEQKKSLLFTRKEFEDLTVSPQEMFDKLAQALNDEKFSDYVLLAKQAKTEDEKSNAKKFVKERLHQILLHEVEMRWNSTPEISRKLNESLIPEREKTYMRSLLQQTESGLVFIKMNNANGERQSTPLETLLETKDQPLEDILASNLPIKKAQVAYVLHQMLSEKDLEDLITEPVKSREEIISNLNKHRLEVSQLPQGVSKLVEKKVLPPGIFKKLRLVMAPLIAYAMIQQGIIVERNLPPLFDNGTKIGYDHGEFPNTELNFPDLLPQSGIRWRIRGTIPTNGYYVYATSHIFKDKRWLANEEIKRSLDAGGNGTAYSDEPAIFLEAELNPRASTSDDVLLKIPIKEGTKFNSMQLYYFETDGNHPISVPFEIYELTDGTVAVKFSKKNNISIPSLHMSVKFLPTSKNVFHAPEHLDPIDTQKLSARASKILKDSLGELPNNPTLTIVDKVRENHEYSLDPPGKDKLKSAKTPEEVVNVITDLSGCFCETCNTASVLLSSTVENETVNMAYGYIASDNNISGTSGSSALEDEWLYTTRNSPSTPYFGALRIEASHAFGINDEGKILDSTPSNPASDKLTQDYVKLLQTSYDPENIKLTPGIGQTESKPASKELVTNEMKLLAALLAASAGVAGAYQGARLLKRFGTKENSISLSDKIITRMYSTKDLQKAYDFFGWLSFGKEEPSLPSSQTVNFSDKKEGLAKIRGNINYEKLAQYYKQPKPFERIAQRKKGMITMADRAKLRYLAGYLLN